MRPLIVAVVLAGAVTGFGYVRREPLPRGPVASVVAGSRNRRLAGKARRRARRTGMTIGGGQ